MSDSEYFSEQEAVVVSQPKKVKATAVPSISTSSTVAKKRKQAAQPDKHIRGLKRSKEQEEYDLFGIGEEAYASNSKKSSTETFKSVLRSRVATGSVQRIVPDKESEYYVEVKVYNTDEVRKVKPEERWQKALVSLKVQLDKEETQWGYLQKFMRSAHTLFNEAQPVFYVAK